MTDPTRGTRYRSLDDVICFDRIPLTNETADRLGLGSQANSRSTDSANETTATAAKLLESMTQVTRENVSREYFGGAV